MSETRLARPHLAKYCTGIGLDIGFGGDAITPTAITFDQAPRPYTHVGDDKQIMRGDCRNLGMFCDDSLDFIYQSHVAEDFTWGELPAIISEWRRVIKPGGYLVNCNPDEPIYSAHCKATKQDYNLAHKNADFGIQTYLDKAILPTGSWEIVYQNPLIDTYSFHLVLKKI